MTLALSLLFIAVRITLMVVVAVLAPRARPLLLAAVGVDALSSVIFLVLPLVLRGRYSLEVEAVRTGVGFAISLVILALVATALARELAPRTPAAGPDNPYAASPQPVSGPGQPSAPGHPYPPMPGAAAPPYSSAPDGQTGPAPAPYAPTGMAPGAPSGPSGPAPGHPYGPVMPGPGPQPGPGNQGPSH